MQRLPQRAALDPRPVERQCEVTGGPRDGFVDEDGCQPAIVILIRESLEDGDPVRVTEETPVKLPNPTSTLKHQVEPCELRSADGRKDVAQAVVVPDILVLVVMDRLAGLCRQMTGSPHDRLVVGDQHPAARRRHDLVAVEGQGSGPPE